MKLLGICAATQDYQLNSDAQEFWRELEETTLEYDSLNSTQTVREGLNEFMEVDVNVRLNQQKRDRLDKLFKSGFDEWFVKNHTDATPLEVWEHLADGLDNRMSGKTVVLAMKIYDIAHLIQHGEYLEFPSDIPIPCDLQVKRVSRTSGVIMSDETDQVLSTWARVMDEVSDQLGRHVSVLRIDSIVWQAGQIIGNHEPDRGAARAALVEHFESVGLDRNKGASLAKELTAEM